VSFLRLFDAPTVFGMARSIDTVRQAERKRSTPLLVPVSREGVVPTSVAQEHLWRLDQILPGTPLFNKLYTARLSGALNITALEQSFHEMIRRHEVLRTTFGLADPMAKQPIQIIAPALQVPLQLDDLRGLAPSERDGAARHLVREAALMPFDLERGPLLRLLLLRLDDQACDLIVVLHSMVSDGWSIGVLAHELSALYDASAMGKPSPLSALPIQYADFACWQRQWLRSPMRDTQLAYWTQRLRDLPFQRALPTDRPRPATLSFRTARQSIEIPKALSEALIQLGRQESSTLFMTLAAAFSLLLHTYTAEDDLVMATTVATRSQPALAGLIGLFTNTVALRFQLGGNPSFRDVLQQVRESTLAAQAHQDLPFEVLLQALECEPGMARASGSQVMFIVQEEPRYPLPFSTLAPSVLEFDQRFELDLTATSFDLIVMIHSGPHGLYGSYLYKTHLFDAASIDRIRVHFRYVLEQICTYPDQSLATIKSLLL
jgi:hypothetical protein